MTRYFRRLLLAACLAPLAATAADPTPAVAEDGGQTTTVLRPVAQCQAKWRGVYVQVLAGKADHPTDPKGKPGLVLYYAPPADVTRDEKDRPVVRIRPFTASVNGAKVKVADAAQLAKLVDAGDLPETTPVEVQLVLRLSDSADLKKRIAETFERQTSAAKLPVVDTSDAVFKVTPLPARELVLTGDDGLHAVLKDTPNPAGEWVVQAKATAAFVGKALDPLGVNLKVSYVFESYSDSLAGVAAAQTVEAFAEFLLNGDGKGELVARQGTTSEFKIVATKSQMDDLRERFKASERVVIRGASSDDINVLLGLLQRRELNLAAMTADQLQAAFDSAYGQKDKANESSWVESIKNLKKKTELDEKEVEDFHSKMKAQASGKSGGFSAFGIGGGGSSYSQLAEGEKKYHRDFARHFLDQLDFNETKGRFEVPKTTTYTLLTRAALTKVMEQELLLVRAGKVSRRVLSAEFNTARPRLQAPLPERTTFGK